MIPVEFRPAAAADVEDAAVWYEAQRPGLGNEFLTTVREAVDAIGEDPKRYPIIYRNARRILLKRFPYSLYYRIEDDRVLVAACIHGRRSPRRWKSRL